MVTKLLSPPNPLLSARGAGQTCGRPDPLWSRPETVEAVLEVPLKCHTTWGLANLQKWVCRLANKIFDVRLTPL
eukprot:s2458_g3.t1